MRLDDFDYDLPEELIAQEPLAQRDASRLLVLPRDGGPIEHHAFRDVLDYLRAGDLLVLNDAKVIPARLLGKKVDTGGKVELVLTLPLGDPSGSTWRCIGQASKAIRAGMRLDFQGLGAEVLEARGDGAYDVRFDAPELGKELERVGQIPLPPYIKRDPGSADRERYQTVFAHRPGAAAAPTAGFHFTEPLLDEVQARGVEIARVTLYVGAGTFLPIRVEEIEAHRMHAERYEVSAEAAEAVARTRARGGRVIAVGTTAARTLESAAAEAFVRRGLKPPATVTKPAEAGCGRDGAVASIIEPGGVDQPASAGFVDLAGGFKPRQADFTPRRPDAAPLLQVGSGVSEIFIYPGYEFRVVDALLTNFHLPKSTLLLLVSALAGRERILAAYREAIERRYRFFSYGDAMLIV